MSDTIIISGLEYHRTEKTTLIADLEQKLAGVVIPFTFHDRLRDAIKELAYILQFEEEEEGG